MNIDRATIEKLADLARIEIDDESKGSFISDLNLMLQFVEKLDDLNTDGIEPLEYMTDESNLLRDDDVKQEITKGEALSNAPKKDSDYFIVPKVLQHKQ